MLRDSLKQDFSCDNSLASTSIRIEDDDALSGKLQSNNRKKYRPMTIVATLRLADLAVLVLAGYLGNAIRINARTNFSTEDFLLAYFGVVVTMVSLHIAGCYSSRNILSLSAHVSKLFSGGSGAMLVILLCGLLSGTFRDYSRMWLVISVGAATAFLLINRLILVWFLQHATRAMKFNEAIVIVGANAQAEKMIDAILGNPSSGISILSIFDDRMERPFPKSLEHRVLGSTDELLNYIRSNDVDRVVVALPWIASERMNALIKKLRTVPVRIDLVPNDIIWQFSGINMERLGTVPVVTVANGRIEQQGGMLKRLEDIVISLVIFVLLCPLLVLIAVMIKLESRGPALFKQRRHGYNNHVFEICKFRSMRISDSADGSLKQATRDDPRITRIGKLLRRLSLDELPQLFNVLKGEMSIVGPRPHAVQHNIEYGSSIQEYFARHNVKPGITGWAQINGLRGETDTLDKMYRRVELDLYYIENWSLLMDLKIICKTAVYVWFQKNAY